MRSCAWAEVLRRIPAEHHNILMIVTNNGTEIALQSVLHLDDELLVLKGRLAGSQDSGRLYFVPLTNIDYVGFNRFFRDEEFKEMFGEFKLSPLQTATPAILPAAPPSEPAVAPAVIEALPSPAAIENISPETTPLPNRTAIPMKSAILERFRSRGPGPMNGAGVKPPE